MQSYTEHCSVGPTIFIEVQLLVLLLVLVLLRLPVREDLYLITYGNSKGQC